MVRTLGIQENGSPGCSKRLSSKAVGESKPEAYPQGYVEDSDEPRTLLADFFSIQLSHGRENSRNITRSSRGYT